MRPWGALHKGSAKGLLLGRPGLRASGSFLETEGRGPAPLALVSSAGQEGVEGVDQLEVRRKRPQLPGQARPLSSNLAEEPPGWEKAGYTWSYLVTLGTHKGQLGGWSERAPPRWQGGVGSAQKTTGGWTAPRAPDACSPQGEPRTLPGERQPRHSPRCPNRRPRGAASAGTRRAE